MAGHWTNSQAVKMILLAWFGHQKESFSPEETTGSTQSC